MNVLPISYFQTANKLRKITDKQKETIKYKLYMWRLYIFSHFLEVRKLNKLGGKCSWKAVTVEFSENENKPRISSMAKMISSSQNLIFNLDPKLRNPSLINVKLIWELLIKDKFKETYMETMWQVLFTNWQSQVIFLRGSVAKTWLTSKEPSQTSAVKFQLWAPIVWAIWFKTSTASHTHQRALITT